MPGTARIFSPDAMFKDRSWIGILSINNRFAAMTDTVYVP